MELQIQGVLIMASLTACQLSLTPHSRPTAGGGTAILAQCGITHHSVPVLGINQLEATDIKVVLAGRPVKILAV
jgi:hypothetical protein